MARDGIYRVPAPLPKSIWRLIRTGDPDSYGSRSQALFAVLLSAVNAGHSAQSIRDLLLRHEAGTWLTHTQDGKPRRNDRAYFDRCWRKARDYAERNPPFLDRGAAFEAIAAVEHAADATTWPGRRGATALALMQLVLALANQSGKVRVAVAIRAAAAELNMDPSTVSRALAVLRGAGWLRRVRKPTATRAAEYEIGPGAPVRTHLQPTHLPDASATHTHTTRRGGLWVADASTDLDADTFCWRGLGWSAARVYAVLDPAETATADALAGPLGVTARTVRRHLVRLGELGLARRVDDGWVRGRRSPRDVAEELGTAGLRETRRAGYAAHREQRAEWLAARRRRGESSGG